MIPITHRYRPLQGGRAPHRLFCRNNQLSILWCFFTIVDLPCNGYDAVLQCIWLKRCQMSACFGSCRRGGSLQLLNLGWKFQSRACPRYDRFQYVQDISSFAGYVSFARIRAYRLFISSLQTRLTDSLQPTVTDCHHGLIMTRLETEASHKIPVNMERRELALLIRARRAAEHRETALADPMIRRVPG
jgi:hypothetical protein